MADTPKPLVDWITTDLATANLTGTEQLHMVKSGASKKTTPAAIAEFVQANTTPADIGAAPALTSDENYVTDTEKLALHAHSNKSALDQVSGINTGDQDLSGKSDTNHNHALNDLSEKSYNSLTDKPTIPAAQVQSDWNAASGVSHILNKPTLGTAAAAATTDFEANRTYTGAVIGTAVTLPNAIAALDDALTVEEYPVTAVNVSGWTILSGTVADLSAIGGNTMIIQEGGGANSYVELQYDGVNLLSDVHLHYRYYSTSGSPSGHTTDWQVFNVTSGLWETLGVATSGNTATMELLTKHLENGADYITADANKRVRVRFLHVSNTSTTHRLELDHVVVSHGLATVGAVTSHAGLGGRSLADQHPTSAITGLEPLVTEARTNLTATNGATSTLDLSLGRSFKIDASALAAGNAFTIALSNVPAGTVVTSTALLLKTGTNVPTVTWPTGVSAPTLAASKTLWGTLATEDNGTTWRWFKAGEF